MRVSSRAAIGVLAAAMLMVGCAAGGQDAIVGSWRCTSPANTTGDAVEIRADGTITVTKPSGLSASGTWSISGSKLTVQGLGPEGAEDFAVAGDKMTGPGGQVCTRSR